jgi:hypothetical protein
MTERNDNDQHLTDARNTDERSGSSVAVAVRTEWVSRRADELLAPDGDQIPRSPAARWHRRPRASTEPAKAKRLHVVHYLSAYHTQKRVWLSVVFGFITAVVIACAAWTGISIAGLDPRGADGEAPQVSPPVSNSAPAHEYPWPDWTQTPRPIGIGDLPGHIGGK